MDAKIDSTHRMLEKMIEDKDYPQQLRNLPKFHDLWHGLDEQVSDLIANYQNSMKQSHKQ